MTHLPWKRITTPGASIAVSTPESLKLSIPPGPAGKYRLAQVDDYSELPRNRFPWRPPVKLCLQVRASAPSIPGTWGFGFWNDPFSLSLGFGGGTRRFPALPNAVWFFFASPPNYLSLRDDIPAQGALAAVIRSPPVPSALLVIGTLALPLLIWNRTAAPVRRAAARFLQQDAVQLPVNPTEWHSYELRWDTQEITFVVDDQVVSQNHLLPRSRLGFVLWIDNQYIALPPEGGIKYGTLANDEESWIEIRQLQCTNG